MKIKNTDVESIDLYQEAEIEAVTKVLKDSIINLCEELKKHLNNDLKNIPIKKLRENLKDEFNMQNESFKIFMDNYKKGGLNGKPMQSRWKQNLYYSYN